MEEAGESGFDELSNETILARYREYRAQSGATQSKGVTEQGVGMAPCDLIRNYVHEHFEGEAEQRRVYEQRWLPMERGCCAAAGAGVEVAAACERGFAPALQQLGAAAASAAPSAAAALPQRHRCWMVVAPPVGIEIYTRFQAWFAEGAAGGAEAAEARLIAFAESVGAALATL